MLVDVYLEIDGFSEERSVALSIGTVRTLSSIKSDIAMKFSEVELIFASLSN